jgi:hypothetical protein
LSGATRSTREHDEEEFEPDYRFTLANERTFLAWLRTRPDPDLVDDEVATTAAVPRLLAAPGTYGRCAVSQPAIVISDFKALHRNTLRAFFTAAMPSDLVFHELALHYRDGVWWVAPASKPMLSKDGAALRDDAGKVRYSPIVSFRTKQARDHFNRVVIAALKLAHPEVFAEDGTP